MTDTALPPVADIVRSAYATLVVQDAGVDQELRMREVGHADKSVNDRYTHRWSRRT